MNKPVKRAVFKLPVLATLLATALGAQAAGLGKLTVYSGIGQPLNAEVALSATPVELNSMSAKLASHEAFQDAGIEFMPALTGMHFSIVKQSNNQAVLKLTTDRPVNEPFLHFLVELNWTAGRMMREYTFLLDPPEMLQVAKPASVVAPAKPAVSTLPPVAPAAEKSAPARAVRPVTAEPAKAPAAPAAGEYQVKRGDTLGKIAREMKPEAVSLEQMLAALFNANPDAFDGHNMNRLRAGKILRVPDAEQVGKVDAAEARKLVIGQAAEFNVYRRRLAEAVGMAPATAEAAPRQQVSGTIKPQVEEKAPAAPAKDKLEVSRTEPAKTAKAVGGSSLEEDLVARDKALREASERIVLLEKNIENLKRLVEIKSQTGAKLQQETQAAAKPAEAQPAPAPAPQAEKPVEPPPATVPAPAVEPPKPVDTAASKPAEPAPAAPAEKKPAAPPPPLEEPSFIDENPQIVYGGGGLVALLLGYLGYASWRRKKQQAVPFEELLAADRAASEPKAVAVPAVAAGMDNAEVSIQSNFGESSLMTAEEIVDPVAEADVLMAYGRDKQAEEILQEGLKHDPARTAIHMKLLELYAKQENLAQFESVANALHQQNNGRGAEWDRAVSMAHKLGISTGIFMGAVTVVPLPSEAPAAVEVTEAAASAAPVAAITEPPAAEEGGLLDFDLDLGTMSEPSAQTPPPVAAEQATPAPIAEPSIEPVAVTPAAEEAAGIDFDFDLGASEPTAAVETRVEEAIAAPAATHAADFDFDLDLGTTSETGAIEAAKEAMVAETPVAPEPLPAPEQAEPEAGEAPGEEAAATPAAGLDLDFDLDLDSGTAAPAEAAAAPVAESVAQNAFQTALTDISLDLAAPPAEPTPPAAPEAEGAGEADVDFSLDLDEAPAEVATATESVAETSAMPDNPEAATKLELAQAYEEMGDIEGARELLSEVVNEGSPAQQAQARAKLEQLAG